MGISIPQLVLILVIALVVFGAGRLPGVMSDLARGLRAFKKGLESDDVVDHAPMSSDSLSLKPLQPAVEHVIERQRVKKNVPSIPKTRSKSKQRTRNPV